MKKLKKGEFGRRSFSNVQAEFLKAKTIEDLKDIKKKLNGSNRDVVQKHYFRALQRILLGQVMCEDVCGDRRLTRA